MTAVLFHATTADAFLITLDNIPATVITENPIPPPIPVGSSGFTAVRPGEHTYMAISVGGVVMTITRQTSKAFDITDNDGLDEEAGDSIFLHSQQGKGASFGKRSIDPFGDQSLNGFIFSFYDAETYELESESNDPIDIVGFSLLAGDYGFDLDSISLRAFNGPDLTGGTVGSLVQDELPGVGILQWTQKRISIVNSGGFQSVLFRSQAGSSNLNFSVFLDRIAFVLGGSLPSNAELDDPNNQGDAATVLPEPASVALLGMGAAMMLIRRRPRPRV